MNFVYYYWISTIEGIGAAKIKQIIDFFGSIENAWHGSMNDFISIKGIRDTLVDKIIKRRNLHKLLDEIESYKLKGIELLSIADNEYPENLRTIYDPPYILYVKGKIKRCSRYLAVVGSRNCTQYGRMAARNISRDLSEYNIGIISGMARGIDTQAHLGALEGNGFTCAVLGCGCDVVYPPENKKLMDAILERGAVISEYPPGTTPNPYNFPARNRIISGMSHGTLIVEAGEKSGALITADLALEQNRDVFAIPGSIFSSTSRGTNSLIKEGAKPVTDVFDILCEFNIECKNKVKNNNYDLTAKEKAVFEVVNDSPVYIDELLQKVSLKINELNSAITSLELKGMLKVLPGRYIVKTG